MAASRFHQASRVLRQNPLSTLHSLPAEPFSTQTVSRQRSAAKRNSPKDPDGTLTTAKSIGTLFSRRSFRDSIGRRNGKNDRNDYYRFFLPGDSNVRVDLQFLKANADVQVLNGSRRVIATSRRPGKQSESINLSLNTGTYYVRVYPRRGATAYNLVLQRSSQDAPVVSFVTASPVTTTGQTSYFFSVGYRDDIGINASSIDSNDILVTGANGFQQTATLDSSTSYFSTFRTATYRLTVPPGGWNASNNGTYQLVLQPNQISDVNGNFAAAATIGSFSVNVNAPPQVAAIAASPLTTEGQSTYTFSVTYSDDIALNASSIDSNDIQVTNVFNGFVQTATLVGSPVVNGTSYTATYQLTAPRGTWNASNNGTYRLWLNANQISDATGKFALPNTIGSFQINITDPFSPLYGYGLVDASAAVARAIGQAPFPEVADGTAAYLWGVNAVKAPEVWARGYRGQGVIVAVLDTGVNDFSPYLSDSIWQNPREISWNGLDDDRNGYIDDVRGWDFANNDNSPVDIDGHGTFIAGVITDSTVGIAPDAKVMPIKIDNAYGGYGGAEDSWIANGIYYAVRNGAKIINLSYGSPAAASFELQVAIRYARQQNVFIVMSAGNDGNDETRPANPGFFTADQDLGVVVGAVDRNNRFADFSNPAGNQPLNYLVAPGEDVYSTPLESTGRRYAIDSGTSFSAPAVAAIAALMLSANPNLTPDQIEQILIDTANPIVLT